jgi:hypothetical protein
MVEGVNFELSVHAAQEFMTLEIKFKKLSYFSSLEKRLLLNHICHAIHHNFTTIYHHAAPQNPQKPLQNSHSTTPE